MTEAAWGLAGPPRPPSPCLPLPSRLSRASPILTRIPLLLLLVLLVLPAAWAQGPSCQELEVSSSQSRQESRRTHGNLTHIPAPAPGGPPVVRLVLSRNSIRGVRAGDLAGYPCLQHLDLSINNVSAIQENAFANASRLRTLVLRRNYLRQLEPRSLAGMTSLEELELSYNLLTALEDGRFSALSSLRVLDLARNNVSTIGGDAFQGLTSLRVLNLTRNWLQVFPLEAFSRLRSLQTLVLDGNRLASLPPHAFSALANLTFLSLNGNRLTAIAPSAFARPQPGLPSPVTHLLLKGTDLASVPGPAFQPLQDLRLLDLSQNDFPELRAGCFQGLGRLRRLVLTRMERLEAVDSGAFRGLGGSLEELVLCRNEHLASIGDGAFQGLGRLRLLDLGHNALRTFSANMADWARVERVDLRGNALHCDCRLSWMRAVLGGNGSSSSSSNASATTTISASNQTRALARNLTCASPPALAGRHVMQVEVEMLKCPASAPEDSADSPSSPSSSSSNQQRVIKAAIAAAVTCVVLFLLLLLFKFRRRFCSYLQRQYRYSAYKENGSGTMLPRDTTGEEEEESPMQVIDLNRDDSACTAAESNGTSHLNGTALTSHASV